MVRIINNNLWSPVPWGWGCGGHHSCGGGNNWMNKMLGYQMMFGMINNMFGRCYMTSPQQESFNPYNPYGMMGLQLGGGGGMPQNYDDYLKQQQEKQDFNELKNSYTEFKFTNIGGEYQATLKSDRTVRFSGSNVLELMDEMNAYIDANPDKFTSKPVATDTEGRGELTGNEDAGAVQNNDDAGAVQETGNTGVTGTGAKVKVPAGWDKTFKYNVKTALGNTPTVDQVIEKMHNFCGMTTQGMSAENKQKLKDDLIKYNPSCFVTDKNSPDYGKCNTDKFSWDKLDLPNGQILKDTYGAKEYTTEHATPAKKDATKEPKIASYRYKDSGGEDYQRLDYNGGNRVYKKNGTSSIDDDAIFVINGKEYKIRGSASNKNLDFCEITEMRSFGNDFKLIDYKTGHFNMDEKFWVLGTYQKYNPQTGNSDSVPNIRKYKFNGTGPLGNCIITWDTEQKKVVLQKNGKNYIMDDIMVGNTKL